MSDEDDDGGDDDDGDGDDDDDVMTATMVIIKCGWVSNYPVELGCLSWRRCLN